MSLAPAPSPRPCAQPEPSPGTPGLAQGVWSLFRLRSCRRGCLGPGMSWRGTARSGDAAASGSEAFLQPRRRWRV